jgi:hypothetical protein
MGSGKYLAMIIIGPVVAFAGISLVFQSFLTTFQTVGLGLILVGGLTAIGGRVGKRMLDSQRELPVEGQKPTRVCLKCGYLIYEKQRFVHCPICGEFLTKVEELSPKT